MSEDNKKKEKALQEKFIEFQIAQQQIGQVQQQLRQISEQKAEVQQIVESISEIGKVKPGSEILVPVVSGIFAKASLKESGHLFVNAGKGVVVKKTAADAKKMLEAQEEEITRIEDHLQSSLEKITAKSSKLEKELQEMLKEAKEDV